MKRNQSGFTLIEIAIVLVIIGLLLGGVLKGQELINSAKVKNMATDFKNIPVFIYGYQDKFKALPGDDLYAVSHVAATESGNGNGVIGGNWNDAVAGATGNSESVDFWQDVRLAGLAPGPTSPTDTNYIPTNSAGGIIGIQSGTSTVANSPVLDKNGKAISGSYIICSSGILGKFVKQLDTTLDDGQTDTGSMLATPVTGYALGAAATATASIDDAASYNVCMGV